MRHLTTKHQKEADKPLDFFKRKLKALSQTPGIQCQRVNITIADNLILPAELDMVEIMVSKQEANKLKNIPLSDNTISRRINDMAKDIQEQLMNSQHFALQFDESTDVSDCAQFVVFMRFEADDKSTCDYDIDWKKCIAICSDGAKAMTGKNSGLIVKLKLIMPNISWTHCFLHQEALAAKVVPPDLNDVLKEVIKIVNSIKDLAVDGMLKMEFYLQSVDVFWMKTKHEYPELTREAPKLLTLKLKREIRLHIENDLIINVSKIAPQFDKLLKNKQAHPSR
ncbi:unnamed protein product [Psylliodes chrysocephalus]|uniref:Uncharacterized protein n=1 Tax=Psylliodes chrysocephalus TaxID=3402493 RepID=A0A9P0CNZ2_9CUCU|nr:unnamed protein product [Psylliodes chrysocephala]